MRERGEREREREDIKQTSEITNTNTRDCNNCASPKGEEEREHQGPPNAQHLAIKLP